MGEKKLTSRQYFTKTGRRKTFIFLFDFINFVAFFLTFSRTSDDFSFISQVSRISIFFVNKLIFHWNKKWNTFAFIIEQKLYEKVNLVTELSKFKSSTENQLRKKDRPVSFIYNKKHRQSNCAEKCHKWLIENGEGCEIVALTGIFVSAIRSWYQHTYTVYM